MASRRLRLPPIAARPSIRRPSAGSAATAIPTTSSPLPLDAGVASSMSTVAPLRFVTAGIAAEIEAGARSLEAAARLEDGFAALARRRGDRAAIRLHTGAVDALRQRSRAIIRSEAETGALARLHAEHAA